MAFDEAEEQQILLRQPPEYYETEVYNGSPVIESGRYWCIAEQPDGTYLRHYTGQPDQIFDCLDHALSDCGVLPDDSHFIEGYDRSP
jgi:hypothetical protein